MNDPLPPQVQDAIDAQLPAIRERLGADQQALDIRTQEKGNGVVMVSVTHARTPTTATFELHPHTEGAELGYTDGEVEYSSSDY